MYIVEGNIGAGKSTFVRLIDQHIKQVTTTLEPLHNWQANVYGQSLLDNFYQKPERWAYTIETLAMSCRVREHLAHQQQRNPYHIVERSIYSGHYCFATNGYQNGFMSGLEWKIYNDWFNFLILGKCHPPHGFIYLRVSPDVAFARIKKRNRLAEKKLSLSYIKQIHERHEIFLVEKHGVLEQLKPVPVLILDANKEFENDPDQLQRHFDAITTFMEETTTGPTSQPPHTTPSIHI